jgi:hypothetical protein
MENASKSDIFETNLELEITNGTAILPLELYDCVEAMVAPVPELEVHLRSHEAFMGRWAQSRRGWVRLD